MKNSSHSSSAIRRSLWLFPALLVSVPLACGRSSDDDGSGVASGGRGEAGADAGDSGGRNASGGAGASTGAASSGASANGGRGAGGEEQGDSGGADGSGASASSGGVDGAGGKASGGGSSDGGSGSGGSGGSSGEHLYDLGAECTTPGEFGCSAANEFLAMICDGDKKWALRETCGDGKKCDFRGGAGVGLCKGPVAGCETATTEPFCGETGVEVCKPGGFDTEVIEACDPGYGCVDAECVLVDDECPEEDVLECEGSSECPGQSVECKSGTTCELGPEQLAAVDTPTLLRIPRASLCEGIENYTGCSVEPGAVAYWVVPGFIDGDAIKVTVGPGWDIHQLTLDKKFPSGCEGGAKQGCVVVPVNADGYAGVVLVPLTSPRHSQRHVTRRVPLH